MSETAKESTLLIDDIRTINVDRIARTYEEGIAALQEKRWDVLYLDHDLGDKSVPEKTGYTIVCWLEQHPEHLPGKIVLVTNNGSGRERMQLVLNRLYR